MLIVVYNFVVDDVIISFSLLGISKKNRSLLSLGKFSPFFVPIRIVYKNCDYTTQRWFIEDGHYVALSDFINDVLAAYPDVFFVTPSQVVEWVRRPQSTNGGQTVDIDGMPLQFSTKKRILSF